MSKEIWLLLTCLACPLSAKTIDHTNNEISSLKQKVSQAITKFEQTKRKNWAYQISRYENEEGDITSSIEQFTPNNELEKQWALMQINGESPTKREIKSFKEKKSKQAKDKDKGKSYSVKLREMINQDSLELISENDRHINIRFNVTLSQLGKDSMDKLQGTLAYNKQLAFIENIIIENNAEFSPIFSSNITDFKLTFTFININDHILPKQHDMEMKGSFAFFTEINEVSTDTYSNYLHQKAN